MYEKFRWCDQYSECSRGWSTWELLLNFLQGPEIFLFPKRVQTGSGDHTAAGYRGLFFLPPLGVKQTECEVDRSPPSSAKINNEWRCISAPPICLHGADRDSFTFTADLIDSVCSIVKSKENECVELKTLG
jgi:hypothetical protein